MRQKIVGFWDGGGISWTICKQSAPCCRQITRPTPDHSIFIGQMLFLTPTHTHTHTHTFNGPFFGTTRVSRYQVSQYQKGKTNLDFTEARDSEWPWHQLGSMQVCTTLQTDNHASTHHSVFSGRILFLPPNQQCQSTEGIS